MRQRALFLFIAVFILSCSNSKFETNTFYSLGTVVNVTLKEGNIDNYKKIQSLFIQYEKLVNDETKAINELKTGEKLALSPLFQFLMKNAEEYYKMSLGQFDITSATVTEKYGFPEGPYSVPPKNEIDEAREKAGFDKIKIESGILTKYSELKINTGAFAKGYIVDLAVSEMKKKGVKSTLINAGGDMYALGDKNGKKWRVAVVHPDEKNKYLSIVNLKDKAIATSGNYERFFMHEGKRIHHIYNMILGEPAPYYKSVSVIADTAEKADGLATVFFLVHSSKISILCNELHVSVMVYTKDNRKVKFCGWQSFEN